MLAEARQALPAVKAHATAPATADDIKAIVGAKFATYRQPERSAAEWDAFWADHFTALEGITASALEAAMDAILKDPTIEFLPKPAKLRQLAQMTPNRAVRAYERCRAAVEYQPPSAPHPADSDHKYIDPSVKALLLTNNGRAEPSEADKARVRRQLAEYRAADDARKVQAKSLGADLPSTAGRPDATGITPALRALRERQAQA